MKKIVLTSLAVSISMIAGYANAIDGQNAAAVNGASPTFMAGSSAATPLIERAFDGVCTGTIFKYSANGSLAYACDGAAGFPAALVLNKRESGGSITGVNAAKNINQSFIDFGAFGAANTISCGAAVAGFSTCTIAGTVPMKSVQSEINFSDVDSAQFASALNGAVANASGLTNTAVAAQIFGVVVNKSLRDAMQAAMVDGGVLPANCFQSETEACMPNLTTEQISTIFGGPSLTSRMTDWRNLRYGNGAATQNLFTAAAAHGLAVPSNRNPHICTRTAGSGTLATFNLKFQNAPCLKDGVNEAMQTLSSQTPTAGFAEPTSGTSKVLWSMSGSGDVEACLEGLNAGAASGTFTPYPVTGARWAIGILGTERNLTNAKNFRFIKIDNVSPAAHNVVEGRYKFWAELVRVGGAITDPVANAILTNMSDPTRIASLIATPNANFGITQLLAVPTNPVTGASNVVGNSGFDPLRPVNPYSHTRFNNLDLNHCRVPTIPTGARTIPAWYP